MGAQPERLILSPPIGHNLSLDLSLCDADKKSMHTCGTETNKVVEKQYLNVKFSALYNMIRRISNSTHTCIDLVKCTDRSFIGLRPALHVLIRT